MNAFGKGRRFTWTYTNPGSPNLEQIITVYPELPYALFEGAVVATSGTTSSRAVNPIVATTTNTLPLAHVGKPSVQHAFRQRQLGDILNSTVVDRAACDFLRGNGTVQRRVAARYCDRFCGSFRMEVFDIRNA